MAETLGPRGPCTAPRRRCCPAWPWTATAWAQPRLDACLPRACPARCRPGSIWLASTSTRTRVSVLRAACPFLSSWDPGEGCLGKATRPVPRRSQLPRRVHGGADSPSSRGGETPGPLAKASPEGPAERGTWLLCLPQRAGVCQGMHNCRNWSHQGLF